MDLDRRRKDTEKVLDHHFKDNSVDIGSSDDDPIRARKTQIITLFFGLFTAALVGSGLYFILHEGIGTIQVVCNVPEARVVMDAANTEYYTDAILQGIPAGEHLITVEKPGYRIEGEWIRRVELKSGEEAVLSFVLVPVDDGMSRSGDHTDGVISRRSR